MASVIEAARERWGSAAVVQGLADPAFIARHRKEIARRLMARGLSPEDADRAISLRLARLAEARDVR